MPRTKQFCQEDVLKKAMELFWEKGFHATSMQDLVSHLGINRASLYDTYGGKEQLFDRAFSRYRQETSLWLERLFERHSSVKDGFRTLFSTAIDEATNDACRKGCFVVNTTTELVPGKGDLLNGLQQHKEQIEHLFIDYVQRGIDAGEIASDRDAQEIGLLLYTFYNGLRVTTKVDTARPKIEKAVDAALSILD